MDLSTTYLGFRLPHPIMPGASPLVDDTGTVKRLEDAGAPMIVMHSLFEEQLTGEALAMAACAETPAESFAEATTYLASPPDHAIGPDEYLDLVRRIKRAVAVPVVASLNGATEGGWLEYARLMEEAGADALEMNVYELAADPFESGAQVENRLIRVLKAVKDGLRIPVAVKLSPYFSSLGHMARRLEEAGADGLILFNRFYQPDLDVENLEVSRTLRLSDRRELPLRLRWLAMLSSKRRLSLAASGGVHGAQEVIKAVMTGAHAVQIVSALLRHGPERLAAIQKDLAAWLEEHEYESLAQMRGSMNLARCPDPKAFARANYMQILQSWSIW
ncbi:MAG: dihydroorotate dehydrogenase-like protein [Acidobacteriota bacterium]